MSKMGDHHKSDTKFTRGEKCIFTHLIISFVGILAVVIVYFVHVLVVRHAATDVFRITRRAPAPGRERNVSERGDVVGCLGAVYVCGSGGVEQAACGAARLAARWAAAPARCVAARTRPRTAPLLPRWTVRYEGHTDTAIAGAKVLRGVVHPQYDDDDCTYNVGLFEHSATDDGLVAPVCALPTQAIYPDILLSNAIDVLIVGWQAEEGRRSVRARALPAARCARLAAAARPERAPAPPPDLCLVPATRAPPARHLLGAVLFVGAELAGISSWGDMEGENYPIMVLELAPFKHWLETTMTL